MILFFSILFIFSFSTILYIKFPSYFLQFEDKINDMMFLTRGERKADKNIVIIDIDEKSLKELGQLPWSRDKVAKIIQNLTNDDAGIIGLDIVFAEEDNSYFKYPNHPKECKRKRIFQHYTR